jgi:type II secretory pathway component PulF
MIAVIVTSIWQLQKRSPKMRKKFHTQLLKLPFVGRVIQDLNIAYITEFLSLSLSTGTSLFKAIKLIGENIENSVYQESMHKVTEHLENGLSLSVALQKEKIYNPFTIRMLNMGEHSGDLESQLYTISEYYSDSVESSTTEMVKVIEPAMIIAVGLIFALIMLGLMGPVFDIVATI